LSSDLSLAFPFFVEALYCPKCKSKVLENQEKNRLIPPHTVEPRGARNSNRKGWKALITTEKVVFQSSSNLPPFEDKEIPLVSVDIYNKKNSRKFQHKMS